MSDERTVLEPGATLGPYVIQSLIGKGGMGEVYLAHDPQLDRHVALKVLGTHLSNDAQASERFIREARSMATISHENIIPIYFIGQEQGLIFFSMEYLKGKTLQDLLGKEEELTFTEILSITRQIVEGLKEAWAKKIIHRDLKPSNIIVDERGRVKILDFGLSKLLIGGTTVTQTGQVLGTPLYMSPELAEGKTCDFRADMYSLGVTLYYLCVGEPPYNAETPLSILYKHVNAPIPQLHPIIPDIPEEFSAIITRLLAKKPEDRFNSYQELADALADIADSMSHTTHKRLTTAQPTVAMDAEPTHHSYGKKIFAVAFTLFLIVVVVKLLSTRGSIPFINSGKVSPTSITMLQPTHTPTPMPTVRHTIAKATATTNKDNTDRKIKPAPRVRKTLVSRKPTPAVNLTPIVAATLPTVPQQKETLIADNAKAKCLCDATLLQKAVDTYETNPPVKRELEVQQAIPFCETPEEQLKCAHTLFSLAEDEHEYIVAYEAYSRVRKSFPEDMNARLKADNAITLLLFIGNKRERLCAHIENIIKYLRKNKASWRDINDQLILRGLVEEKLYKRRMKARKWYIKARFISKDRGDIVYIPSRKKFEPVPLYRFLKKHF